VPIPDWATGNFDLGKQYKSSRGSDFTLRITGSRPSLR
jgi:hypothetical protein